MSGFRAETRPWFHSAPVVASKSVVVLGAGLAGSAVAWALAEQGCRVTVVDRAPKAATAASGNPAAVVLPLPTLQDSDLRQFYLVAYRRTLQTISNFERNGHDLDWKPTGVIHLPARHKIVKQIAKLNQDACPPDVARVINAKEASQRSGLPLSTRTLLYESGGFLNPAKLCAAWLNHPRIECRFDIDVDAVQHDGYWHLLSARGHQLLKTEILVLANGHELARWQPTRWLPLAVSGGRLITVPTSWCSHPPRMVICHKGYAVPLHDRVLLGATWHPPDTPREPSIEAHQELIAEAARWLPGFQAGHREDIHERFAYRAKTEDHLPIAGPAPDLRYFLEHYDPLHQGRPDEAYPPGRFLPGLYLCGGLGARGVVASILTGELCASAITGRDSGLADNLHHAVQPARFIIRDLKRKPADRRLASPTF